MSHFIGCPRTVTSVPHRRRRSFFTAAKASGSNSCKRRCWRPRSLISASSAFQARGFWTQLAYELPLPGLPVRFEPYARYEQRRAQFQGYTPVHVDRTTVGLHVDLWDSVQLKGEVLFNRELDGTPVVDNNVYTSSVVWTW